MFIQVGGRGRRAKAVEADAQAVKPGIALPAPGDPGLDRFGASAPAPDLYKYFGLTVEAIVPKILEKLGK